MIIQIIWINKKNNIKLGKSINNYQKREYSSVINNVELSENIKNTKCTYNK